MEETTNVTPNETVELNTNEAPQQDTSPKPFEIPTEAKEFVGEGKKYSSAEEALKSVPHAQQHIQTLEDELAELRTELAKRKTTQELMDEIKSGIQKQPQTEIAPEFNQDKLREIVNNTLQQNEVAKIAKANAGQVAAKFNEVYGDKAEQVYNQLAKDSGLSISKMNDLAMSSPNAVLKLAGLAKTQAPVSKTTGSSVNTEALKQQPQESVLTAKVRQGASTKDLVDAWKIAGEKVKQQA